MNRAADGMIKVEINRAFDTIKGDPTRLPDNAPRGGWASVIDTICPRELPVRHKEGGASIWFTQVGCFSSLLWHFAAMFFAEPDLKPLPAPRISCSCLSVVKNTRGFSVLWTLWGEILIFICSKRLIKIKLLPQSGRFFLHQKILQKGSGGPSLSLVDVRNTSKETYKLFLYAEKVPKNVHWLIVSGTGHDWRNLWFYVFYVPSKIPLKTLSEIFIHGRKKSPFAPFSYQTWVPPIVMCLKETDRVFLVEVRVSLWKTLGRIHFFSIEQYWNIATISFPSYEETLKFLPTSLQDFIGSLKKSMGRDDSGTSRPIQRLRNIFELLVKLLALLLAKPNCI